MGRHTAPDGDARHPVVAEALARRGVDAAGAHRDGVPEPFATQRIESNLGWPGEPPAPGGGIGWPGDLPQDAARGTDPSADADDDIGEHPEEPAHEPGGRRRGWRRLLGRAA